MEEITLDVIPIYKNEIFPTKNEYMHFVNKKEESISKTKTLEHMIQQISDLFYECNCVIILEKGKVIEILVKEKSMLTRCY
ncbi:MAG TPA: hypothetical protein IAB59_07100 [Candidatus Onthousia faecipullorum]|uniref:Uncharacterized protein n=1 Tax=Candidatus Onthousia faecipullorum TaxID=2840887 RepID=A0A9D1GC72_9FIRM|nr:hypothetical protein [Candidatus Onthousia faecipullorum]